jgi:hypothetical protein
LQSSSNRCGRNLPAGTQGKMTNGVAALNRQTVKPLKALIVDPM